MSIKDDITQAEALTSGNPDEIWLHILISLIAVISVYFIARLKKPGELKEINTNFQNVVL